MGIIWTDFVSHPRANLSGLVTQFELMLSHTTLLLGDKDTTKLRIVYDVSSRVDGPSLNDWT